MTCVAGLVERGVVYMAADSAGSDTTMSLHVRADWKIFRSGKDMLVGICGSFRMRDLLRYQFSPPKYDHRQYPDPIEYMVAEYVEAIRKRFRAGGVVALEHESVESFDGDILVGFKRRLFTIHSDYQVAEQTVPFAAVGCGADIALGSLWSTAKLKLPPMDRLRRALEASERYNAGVRAPFHFDQLTPEKRS